MVDTMTRDDERQAVAAVIRDGLSRRRGAKSELAHELGISPATVSKWVQGHTIPEVSRWGQVEELLELEAGSLARAAGIGVEDEAGLLRQEVGELRLELESFMGRVLELLGDDTDEGDARRA